MRLALVLLLAAAPALAAVPEAGEGTIAILGGIRSIVPSNHDYLVEQGATHGQIQPGGIASFGYQYDQELHFKIEIGYMLDSYRIPTGDLSVHTIPILLALDTALWKGKNFTLYGGGGIGYSLNTGTRNGIHNEANSTAGYVCLGFRMQIAGPLAWVVEDRWTLASAQVDAGNSAQSMNVGGNFFSVGVLFHFLEPEGSGPPTHH